MIKKTTLLIILIAGLLGFIYTQEEKKEKIDLDAATCYQKCIECLKQGDADQAIKYGEKAVELEKDNSTFHFQLGLAYNSKVNKKETGMMDKMGLAMKMLDSWKKAVELDGTNLPARQGLAGFYLNAPPIAGGSVEKALEQAEEILKIDENTGNMVFIGIHQKNGDFDKAIAFSEKVVKNHVKCLESGKKSTLVSGVLNALGYAMVRAGKNDEAVRVFEMNVKAFPKHFNVYDSLGEIYMKMGKRDLAIKNYEKALKLNPNKTDFEKSAFEGQKKSLEELKSQK